MASTTETKGRKAKEKSKEQDTGADANAAAASGPSVAAHPRAARHVARAKGWAGLLGFLVAGYLSLPTNTLASAGLRALVAGVVCYLVAWAGAVFVWRELMLLELAGVRARTREHLESIVHAADADASTPGRRQNVRVRAERPVVAFVGSERKPAQTFTIDISAGGFLVAGLTDLQKGEPFEFELSLAPSEAPIKGTGTVVRTDAQGRCAIAFKRITRADERRLDQFIFQCLRSERQGMAA
ncbi:MAG TPA: PilZ domain-containing protein [Solirubrobacteraceae bacterium]|nr:PilZ domain-containing protein [Solirubrobacteraceae bacterium]